MRQFAEHGSRFGKYRRPGQPAGFLAVGQVLDAVAGERGIGGDDAVEAVPAQRVGNGLDLQVIEIGRNFQCQRHVFAVPVSECDLLRLEARQKFIQRLVLLQFAQVFGIGGRNVDRDVTGVRVNLFQTDQVILGSVLHRCGGVLADVDAEDAAFLGEFGGPDVGDQGVDTGVVEAHPVDDGLRLGDAEQTRFRVACLRSRCDRADFEETEAQSGQGVDVVAVLVQPGGESDRIGKVDAHHFHRAGGGRFCQDAEQTGRFHEGHAAQADTVCTFGILGKKELANERIEHDGVGLWRHADRHARQGSKMRQAIGAVGENGADAAA